MLIFKFLSHRITHAIYLIKSLRSIKSNLNIISTIWFNGNFLWTTPSPPSPSRRTVPHEIPPGLLPPDFSPWIITPGQLPPGQLPPRTVLPGLLPPRQLPLNNSPLKTSPRTITPLWNLPRTITPQNFGPQIITFKWLPLSNCHQDNYPHEIPVNINNRNIKKWVKVMVYGNKTN